MSINISRKDVLWSYLSQFFSIASGIITLPLILNLLTTQEIGLNYLMLTVGSLVMLFDFGFTPQFSRNISYVFSGARELKKDGLEHNNQNNGINYRLLASMIKTAQMVYWRLATIAFLLLLTLGTYYIYHATNKFTSVENSFWIWLIYSISVFFNLFYAYYGSLLLGRGQIMESRKANVYSKIIYIALTFIFLYLGLGLIGVALSGLIAPFLNRYLSYKYFFTKDIRSKVDSYQIPKEELLQLFNIIWFNSKKLGLVFVASYAINKLSMFLAGLYLSLEQVASYGLMIQFSTLILTISSTMFTAYQPKISSLRVLGDKVSLLKSLSFSMSIYYVFYILGSIILLVFGPFLLKTIGSNANLPEFWLLSLFLLVIFLEGNHSNFATFIVSGNNIPFVKSALISGAIIGLGSYLLLSYTKLEIWGLVLIQGITQLAYANWKWPLVVLREFDINLLTFFKLGFIESGKLIKKIFNRV